MAARKTLEILRERFPGVHFAKGTVFSWHPKTNTVYYPAEPLDDAAFMTGIIHEIAHSELGHKDFKHDIELLKMERDAWILAGKLIAEFGGNLDRDHIEDCLDSYRDWLYSRSKCPQCNLVGIQSAAHAYSCIHCSLTWKVPTSRLCTVKRKVIA